MTIAPITITPTIATVAAAAVPIRRALPADVAAIVALLVREFRLLPVGQDWLLPLLRFGIETDVRQRLGVSRYACLVATNADQAIVGTVEVGYRAPLPWQWDQDPYAYLSNLAVRSTERRQGIAQQLIAASEALVQEWQGQDLYLHVMADNLAARQLYLQQGYAIHQVQDEWRTWLGGVPRLFLHKRLVATVPPIVSPTVPPIGPPNGTTALGVGSS
jgi:ribosomal protein S18 acetylase RimI-like enzyme